MKESIEKQVHDFAEMCYTEGYNDGRTDAYKDNVSFASDAYERGANEAWECARKITLSTEEGGIPTDTLQRLFGFGWYNTIKNISAADAIITLKERLNKEEEPKLSTTDEIKVGTRVRTLKDVADGIKLFSVGTIGVVVEVDNNGDDGLLYKIDAGDKCWWYSGDMFEVIPEDEIVVGDEVYFCDKNYTRVVMSIFCENGDNPKAVQFTESGKYVVDYVKGLHKTGRHFSQIDEVLRQLKVKSEEYNGKF